MTINNKLIAIKERYDQINTKLSGENSLKSEELINLNKEMMTYCFSPLYKFYLWEFCEFS